MANNGAIVFWVSFLSLLCMVNNIICSISSKEARILNTKLGMFEYKLFTALIDIDDIRSSKSTCQCPSQKSSLTDASVAELDFTRTNGIEESESKEVQSCATIVTKGFSGEKQARKMFEKQMVNLIKDKTQSPIHGGWANWTPYGVCSQTCGIGLKRRHRECSKPFPRSGGNPCYGDYTDDKICMEQECQVWSKSAIHGGWADWAPWEGCSQSCGIGLKRRRRECYKPYPKSSGSPCDGDNTDDKICMEKECPRIDGGWGYWASWSQCTATCNGGLRTRGRNCNNPKPSSHGRYCTGYNMNSQLCNTKNCPGADYQVNKLRKKVQELEQYISTQRTRVVMYRGSSSSESSDSSDSSDSD